jgi:translation initiation factor IF-2
MTPKFFTHEQIKMAAQVEILPPAIFNRQAPIVVAVRVLKGRIVPQMEIREHSTGSAGAADDTGVTQRLLGILTDIEKDMVEVQEGGPENVYAIKIEWNRAGEPPALNPDFRILGCQL